MTRPLRIELEDAHVLDRRDGVILDLLPPETPPTGTFEVMIVSRVRKTALHQMMAPFTITSRSETMCLSTR